ncbi:MAG TPA: HAD family phosphatase [Thermomicrobiaceae bacterium]|nr:HAD family phosphatase [Thermomicrobiaceae bacterium]
MSAPLEAAVFDLDGLLVDSEPVQIAAWEEFLAGHGHTLDPELLGRLFGLRVRDTSRVLVDELRLPLSPDEVFAGREAIFFRLLEAGVRPMPAAVETVRALGARGLRLGLATSGHRRYADLVLGGLGLIGAFAVEVTGDEVARGKPAPDIYLLAAARLGVPPAACLALEDAPFGVAAAVDAGMRCLAVPNVHTTGMPGLERADAILPSLAAVVPWLEARGLLPPG